MVRGTVDGFLEHHGIKGMKWGVRRKRGSDGTVGGSHPSSADASKASDFHARVRASGTHSLSNQELQHLVNRMNLEQQYSKLSSTQSSSKKQAGAKFITGLLKNTGKQQAQNLTNDLAKKEIAKLLAKAAAKKAAQAAVVAAL